MTSPTGSTVPTVGILVFEGAEELDWAGPWEVFSQAAVGGSLRAVTVGTSSPVRSAKGLVTLPDHSLDDAPHLDLLLVPGGLATRALRDDEQLVGWIRERSSRARWTASVCTGAMLLEAAGVLDGRKATTHWMALDELGTRSDVEVVRGARYVIDDPVATSAGVSAGIDLALRLVEELVDEETARTTALFMEYDPDPPYAIAEQRGF
jgi:transcriptional regulator GlxA family with amidase domain